MRTIFVFIDESGDLTFSPKGTKYFHLTSVTTTTPAKNIEGFSVFRYKLLQLGHDQEFFHATEDRQCVRNQIFQSISTLEDLEIDAVLIEKRKVNPQLYQSARREQPGERVYELLLRTLLESIFNRRSLLEDVGSIVISIKGKQTAIASSRITAVGRYMSVVKRERNAQ